MKNGIVGPIRNQVANEILSIARCSSAYRGVLGKKNVPNFNILCSTVCCDLIFVISILVEWCICHGAKTESCTRS